jgi:hypothetical protein
VRPSETMVTMLLLCSDDLSAHNTDVMKERSAALA